MSKLSIHTIEKDFQTIKELMLKHDWALVRFPCHDRDYEPYTVLFGKPDVEDENEALRKG